MDTMVLANADELLDLLAGFPQVRLVLSGHVHQALDKQRGTIRLLATPSTCFQFKPYSAQFALDDTAPGYRWLELFEDGTVATAIRRVPTMPQGLDVHSAGY